MDFIDLLGGAAIMAVVWSVLMKNRDGMSPLQQTLFGRSLAQMATLHEIAQSARNDPQQLSSKKLAELDRWAERISDKADQRFRAAGPYVVTRELLKNMRLAASLGRSSRVQAQEEMLDLLVRRGLAVEAWELALLT